MTITDAERLNENNKVLNRLLMNNKTAKAQTIAETNIKNIYAIPEENNLGWMNHGGWSKSGGW